MLARLDKMNWKSGPTKRQTDRERESEEGKERGRETKRNAFWVGVMRPCVGAAATSAGNHGKFHFNNILCWLIRHFACCTNIKFRRKRPWQPRDERAGKLISWDAQLEHKDNRWVGREATRGGIGRAQVALCQGTRRNLCHPVRVMLYTNSTVDADSPLSLIPHPFFVPSTPLKLTFGNNCEQRRLRCCLRLPGISNSSRGRLLRRLPY